LQSKQGDERRKPGEVRCVFDEYLKDVFKDAKGGKATEPTYYPHLKKLLEAVAPLFGKTKVKVDILPKRTEGGCPDIVVWDGEQHVFGYVECKDVGADLTPSRMSKPNKEQFKRYLETFPNLIYTNFTEFRLYRDHDSKPLLTEQLCESPEDIGFKAPTGIDAAGEAKALLERFFDFSLAKKYTARTLAQELAKRTRFLKDEVAFEQEAEASGGKKNVTKFFNAFKGTLIKNLKEEDFADLFSQTITFGLFAARYRTHGEFNRKLAYDSIPPTIGVLHDLFEYISRGKLPPLINQIVNDIAEVLSVADVHKILDDYYKEGKGKKDPIFDFYETFLLEYNPKEKQQRGVFFTPEPVVGFIVRSVHKLLQSKFKKPEGLGYYSTNNPKRSVMLLDPAGGTLTFLAEASTVAIGGHVSVHGDGDKNGFIRNHILENFYAFELIMAPYVLGHLKMSFLLDELGYELGDDERFKFYLTNTLTLDLDDIDEQMKIWEDVLPSFVAEADAASEIKKDTPILVIVGNPPYSGHSANPSDELDDDGKPIGHMLLDIRKSGDGFHELFEPAKATTTSKKVPKKTFIGRLIEDYKIDQGEWLKEKNTKWLQDDYVKFIRFAQWKIDQKGEGILGFITNHAYIDNPTFPGMRKSLMHSFDEIYILDLHGNYKKKETCPDGSKDENVFDIQQGTAIGLFVKTGSDTEPKIFHHELWGLRQDFKR
jgi:predicted helicase